MTAWSTQQTRERGYERSPEQDYQHLFTATVCLQRSQFNNVVSQIRNDWVIQEVCSLERGKRFECARKYSYETGGSEEVAVCFYGFV
jgi:hypothetical protein